MDRLLRIDRRIIFAVMFLGVVVALLLDFHFPIHPTDSVQAAYDTVNRVADEKSPALALMCFSYGASSEPEMQPMAVSLLRHLFGRDVKVVAMCLWPEASGLAQKALEKTAGEFGLRYGRDYVFVGYKPGANSVILNMGRSFRDAFPLDAWGARVDTLALTRDIGGLADFDLVIDLAAGDSIEYWWIPYGQERFGFPFVAGCTAVMAPGLFPFLQSGQLAGFIGGLAGAAEYEHLVGRAGAATAGMRVQSITHLIIIVFVLMGNVTYFLVRRRGRRSNLGGGLQ